MNKYKGRLYDDEAKAQIKDAVDVVTACEISGIEVHNKFGRLLIQCPNPNHNDVHLGNCSINNNKGSGYLRYAKCFACGEAFDSFKIIELGLGKSFPEAVDYAAEHAGLTHLAIKRGSKTYKKVKYRLLSPDEREFLGFTRGSKAIMIPYAAQKEKPEYEAAWEEEEGGDYVLYRHESHDFLREKWKEEPDVYRALVCGKAVEAIAHWTKIEVEEMVSALTTKGLKTNGWHILLWDMAEEYRKKAEKLYYEFGGIKRDAEEFVRRWA